MTGWMAIASVFSGLHGPTVGPKIGKLLRDGDPIQSRGETISQGNARIRTQPAQVDPDELEGRLPEFRSITRRETFV
jgi:hypothetical protein